MKSFFIPVLIIFSGLAFVAGKVPVKTVADKLLVLKRQVIKDILAARVNEKETMFDMAKMGADGAFGDIDYTDKTRGSWPVNEHLVRLNDLAILYTRPGTKYTGDRAVRDKIVLGLNYWFKNDFICPNWWYPEIGVPKVLGPTMLLMEDELTPTQIDAGIRILNRSKIGMTGQNKVWLSGNVVYRSLLTGDTTAIQEAVKAIQEEVVVSEGEGIQQDNSFHQHGPQQQFGNYGAAYAGDILKWAGIFQNTAYQFEPDKVAIMRNYLLDGMRWVIWKNKMDISACGRQLFPNTLISKANNMKSIFARMPAIDPPYADSYKLAVTDFAGDKHFWKSDMTVHRRANFYTSVKMSSNRVGGAESCNEENVLGYHLGDGATYFYQSGAEYLNIFPLWDWKMIPGTTTYHDEAPLPVLPCSGYRIASDFVGGVSDGMNGIATLAYQRDSLSAQKSWFFFNEATICLGAGIHSEENKPVFTTVNQSFLHGDVLVKQGTVAKTLETGEHALKNVPWVIHDNWGYYFPGHAAISITNREQSGSWKKVLTRMPPTVEKGSVFTLWFDHQARPDSARYAYYVFPGATQKNIETLAAGLTVVANSAKLQAVESKSLQAAGIVFVQPGQVSLKLFKKISADKPCVVMAGKKGAGMVLQVSDPTHNESELVIGVEGKRKISGLTANYDMQTKMSYFTVHLPEGADAGKSIPLVVE